MVCLTLARRVVFAIAFTVSATVLSSCGSDVTTVPIVTSIAGTWNLVSVEGKPLPYLLQASDPKFELTDRQYVFSATGSFTLSYGVRATELDGSVSTARVSDKGTSTLADNVVTIRYDGDGSMVTAQVDGNTMTIISGLTQILKKQ